MLGYKEKSLGRVTSYEVPFQHLHIEAANIVPILHALTNAYK